MSRISTRNKVKSGTRGKGRRRGPLRPLFSIESDVPSTLQRGCLLLLIAWWGSNAPRPRPKGGGDRVAASGGRAGIGGETAHTPPPARPAAVGPGAALCRALRAGHLRYVRAYNPPRLAARRLCAHPSLRGALPPLRLLGPRPGGGVCVPGGACSRASGGPAAKGPPGAVALRAPLRPCGPCPCFLPAGGGAVGLGARPCGRAPPPSRVPRAASPPIRRRRRVAGSSAPPPAVPSCLVSAVLMLDAAQSAVLI